MDCHGYRVRLRVWGQMVSKEQKPPPACLGDPCDESADPELCQAEEMAMGPELVLAPIVDTAEVEKRDFKSYRVWCSSRQNWSNNLRIFAFAFPPAGDWNPGDRPHDRALTWVMGKDDCSTPLVQPQIREDDDDEKTQRYNSEYSTITSSYQARLLIRRLILSV